MSSTIAHSSSQASLDTNELAPTLPARNPDVSDGVWDDADRKAVDEALKDAEKISRQAEKYLTAGQTVILGTSLPELEQVSHTARMLYRRPTNIPCL